MKSTALLCFVLLCCTACKKDILFDPSQATQFTFGLFFGECSDECIAAFRLNGDQLRRDTVSYYPGSLEDIDFVDAAYTRTEIAQVQALLADFPPSVWLRPQGPQGCVDCADGGGLLLELTLDGESRHWSFDPSFDPESADPEAVFFTELLVQVYQLAE